MNEDIENILKFTNIKSKYITLIISNLDISESETYYSQQARLSLEKISLKFDKKNLIDVILETLKEYINGSSSDEYLLKILGILEISLDRSTLVGVGYGITFSLCQNIIDMKRSNNIAEKPKSFTTLKDVVDNKKEEIQEYYESLDKTRGIASFIDYLRFVNTMMYLDDILLSNRYKIEDIIDISIVKLFETEILINIEIFLQYLYSKILNVEKSQEFFENLLVKYPNFYVLLLQRIYRNYIDTEYIITNNSDDKFEDIIIIGGGEVGGEDEEVVFTKKKENYNHLIKTLFERGVVVIPVLGKEELRDFHNSIIKEVYKFPEYIPDDRDLSKRVLVLGGFGALGNPSSLHNMTSRKLRKRIMDIAKPFFKKYVENYISSENFGNIHLEQLLDRLSIRKEGTATTAESWHRDVAPLKSDFKDDNIFGGWLNLDISNDQYFSCVPTTQFDVTGASGFVKDADQKKIESIYRPRSEKIKVPPGHWICFFQNIMHEVFPTKQKTGFSMKQYFGWRLTKDTKPLFKTLDKALKEQGLPQIPSGQIPWMYGPSHIQFHKQNLIDWSIKTFKPQCLEDKVSGKGEKYIVVKRFMKSLKELDLDIYDDYDVADIEILKPQKL